MQKPVVERLSSRQSTQSASEKACIVMEEHGSSKLDAKIKGALDIPKNVFAACKCNLLWPC